jgi:hypothetical protein
MALDLWVGYVTSFIDLRGQSHHPILQFPVKPDKDVDLVNDFVKSQFDSPRTLWSTKVSDPSVHIWSMRQLVPCRLPMPD